ncbi:HD domain-containing protein [Exiguobacterium sp. MER 193]|uniref:HD domain-containing protein n=1 Tax=Exiguobacterium sp. MER 193 TaxID=2939564 RepID=UPI00203B3F61|nr:HD domain-containing protein [Exiguobacterium sp. MER 193]MCM3281638.1 HD domain-containing protein [Exiguobacterium sp. MER 193]
MYSSRGQLSGSKVFKDPVHRYIYVYDHLIWELINTKEFQRLRRIKQLGTSFLTFHGAEHTRFHHSLGVYEIARQLIDQFQQYPEWNDRDRELLLAAALLHDVGHGPFSHAFEHVFSVRHEVWTERIILGETEVNKVLSEMGVGFAEEVASIINKSHPNRLIVNMLSSQLDVDRMDYLLRDAHFAGVSYGKFDLERMLRVLRPDEDQVVVKQSGMHTIEDYIMRRYQMYWQVYLHPATRSSDLLLKAILERAQELYEGGYEFNMTPKHFLPIFERTGMSLEQYLRLDETVVYFYFQEWMEEDDAILADLASRFVNRRLLKYKNFPEANRVRYMERLRQTMETIGLPPTYYLLEDQLSQLPYDLYKGQGKYEGIYLQMNDGERKEISEVSMLVQSILNSRQSDEKIYYPEDVLLNLKDDANEKSWILSTLKDE